MYNPADVIQSFTDSFGYGKPSIYYAAGKVNFLGEHLAIANEIVLEATIHAGIYIAIDKATNNQTHIINNDAFEQCFIDANNVSIVNTQPVWQQYMQHLFAVLHSHKFITEPLHILFGGNLPANNALYYHAALIMGVLQGCNNLFNWQQSIVQLAQLATTIGNKVEENYYSITDFITIAAAKENSFIAIDASNNEFEIIPVDTSGFELLITNSAYQYTLPSSFWEERKEELQHALSFYKTVNKRINTFRQVNSSVAEQFMYSMDDNVAKRSLYIAEEIERVQQGIQYCKENNWAAFGNLLFKNHKALTDLYETTNTYLNFLVTESKLHSNCLGSKQLGKQSFMLSLVKPFCSDIIATNVITSYKSVYQLQASTNAYAIGNGLHQVFM